MEFSTLKDEGSSWWKTSFCFDPARLWRELSLTPRRLAASHGAATLGWRRPPCDRRKPRDSLANLTVPFKNEFPSFAFPLHPPLQRLPTSSLEDGYMKVPHTFTNSKALAKAAVTATSMHQYTSIRFRDCLLMFFFQTRC